MVPDLSQREPAGTAGFEDRHQADGIRDVCPLLIGTKK